MLAVLALVACDAETGEDRAGAEPPTPASEPDPVPPKPDVEPESDVESDPAPAPDPRPSGVVATHDAIQPVVFDSPGELANELVAATTAIRDVNTSDAELRDWALIQQQAYRDLVVNPGWQDQVRDTVPERFVAEFDRNLLAAGRLRELTSPRTELPDWRIVEPPPADELREYYEAAEDEFGVPWEYLASIHLSETRMGRIRGVSVAGAQGPMQFMPATWDAYGEGDINDPQDAIRAAARYLTASGAPGNMPAALFAYNRSDKYVDAIIAQAEVIAADARAFNGYYHWQVFYRLEQGDVILPVGWERQ